MPIYFDLFLRDKPITSKNGFTLIETLVSSAIFIILLAAISIIVQQTLENVMQARIRTVVLSVAQQQMETLQNLPYIDVGTIGGIPSGPIEPEITTNLNGQNFKVDTMIVYIDDPYDGLAENDSVNTDYKRVKVQVSWTGSYSSPTPIVLVSNIAPKGLESQITSGTLNIKVYDSNGVPVPAATIDIDNANLSPEIHMQIYTDNNGNVQIPGAPTCINCYSISASKNNFSTDRTYTQQEVANPIKPPVSVFNGETTSVTFSIDRTSTLTLQSYSIFYAPRSFVWFDIKGSKIIGYDTNDNPVYKYSYSGNTGTYIRSIYNLEWDIYDIDLTPYGNNYAGSNPIMPITLAPNMNLTVPFIAGPLTSSSILIAVKNLAGTLQSSASAILKNSSLGYELTKTTPSTGSADMGQVYFYNLTPETYDWQINMNGYKEATGSVYIDTNKRLTVTLEEI